MSIPGETKVCTIKALPRSPWVPAARLAIAVNPANAPMYWGTAGVRLTVSFLDEPTEDLRARILEHMNAWGVYANVGFVEVDSNGQVRIARRVGDGYWSYLGTDVLAIPTPEPTMNLDSFTMDTPESEFVRVIRHETGHTLGFPHEHLRSQVVNRIDRQKAIAYFQATQGWPPDMTIAQVLTPLENSALTATATPDQDSIMCYWLPASIMIDFMEVRGGADINATDGQFAGSVYRRLG
ncbi:hypothetical protein B0I37DRAFT_356533 [Chaetomium sp. MPI-CAGE-AT-0009]|nr:hypothetical protein B0I37DRAFT_356533 [Chaetomium sp. MPI-CAGE-AT-0009]